MISRLLATLLGLFASSVGPHARADDAASVRVEILVAEAEKLYRTEKTPQAIAKYDQASALAFAEGAVGRAFELSRTAAAILQASGEEAKAGQRLRRLALGSADHPDAAATHWAAVVCLWNGGVGGGNAQQNAAELDEALREHLDQWREAPSARQAYPRRVRVLLVLQDWREAAALCEQLGSAELAAAGLLPSYASAVIALRGEADSQELLRHATNFLQPAVTGPENQWPTEWDPSQRQAALTLARIHLAYGAAGPRYPYRLLAASATGAPRPTAAWDLAALPSMLQAAAAVGDWEVARQVAARASRQPTSALRPVVVELSRQVAANPSEDAALELLADFTQGDDLPDDPGWLQRGRLLVRARRGDADAADQLAAEPPAGSTPRGDDRRLAAQTLAKQADEESQQRALSLWTQLERPASKGSREFHEARVARIELLDRLGRREEAAKLWRLTEALYKPPADERLRARREELARRLGAPR
ncbi:hypothetical protein Pla123a_39190 [Posidoniimonas polymericola]|uniref:Tetratricopeptide repeat protein n=1 Tax=Posidoniimonas polymericola TaxID=2528002 RepID=A0A5C5YFK3_9BACT|nr:hypothetical protein [Posidoniimonas polymericola]TWT73583.1 hypothetical protein Pla123a_39190 [Posidoniimonas polymericola]